MTTAPPRWLTLDEAAAYLRLREDRFRRMVRAGKLPAPSRRLGPRDPRWDRHALDQAMSGELTSTRGADHTDPDAAVQGLANDIRAGRL